MIQSQEMLLVCEGPAAERLSEQLGSGRLLRRSDPYEALLELSRRQWSAVVVAGPQPGFEGLCRAMRRLQPDARLYALCPPSAEAEVRPLAGEVLDDYFIYPPTDEEMRRIADPQLRAGGGSAGGEAVSADDLAALVEATRTVEEVEGELAGVVGRRLGCRVQWLAADAIGAAEPLLLIAGDAPRALVGAENVRIAPADRQYLAAIQRCAAALMGAARRTESLHRLAVTDYLTGAFNRRYFYHVSDQILQRKAGGDARVSLLLFDIDNFKRYNDTYGHAAGDEILREITRLIQQTTRSQDIVARIGGDEFAVLFWDNAPRQAGSRPPDTATMMADRFRKAVGRHEFPSLGPEARGVLTISGGLANFPDDGRTCRELLRSADRALRAVKETGKNAIRLIGDETE